MAVVNKFNVNNKQVTLDADIIENMSANDVSYDASTQYDENTVGEKLSELEKEVIYDVTVNNDGATFASLSELLLSENLYTLIPTSVRHGGMSIRFIKSSDNKYVQYMLMSDTFNTTVANWQGVDDEPTTGSNNLVKSGGVAKEFIDMHVKSLLIPFEVNNGYYVRNNISIGEAAYLSSNTSMSTNKYNIIAGKAYTFSAKQSSTTNVYVINWVDDEGIIISREYLGKAGQQDIWEDVVVIAPKSAVTMWMNLQNSSSSETNFKEINDELIQVAELKENLQSQMNNTYSEVNNNRVALSKKSLLTPFEIKEGYFAYANVGETEVLIANKSMQLVKYNVVSGKLYLFNAHYTGINVFVLHWLDTNNIVLKTEYKGTGGDVWTNVAVTAPVNATEMWMNVQNRYSDETNFKEVDDELIQVENLQSQIDNLHNQSGDMKVVINGIGKMPTNSVPFYIRTAYNLEKDIIITHRINNNDLITLNYVYIGDKLLTDKELMTETYLVSSPRDSTSPLRNYTQYWHLFTQHGYLIPYFDNSVGMTSDDVGAEWKDQLDRRYKIGKVTDDYIWLLPVIYQDEDGHYTRDWNSQPFSTTITSLTHVSGGSYTQQITVSSISQEQLCPIMEVEDRKYLINGNIVTEPGTYYADEIKVSETEIGYDPATINDWFGNDGKPNLSGAQKHVIFTYNYNYKGAHCSVNTTIHCLREARGYYGGTQHQFFFDKGDYKAMFMIPKAAPRDGIELDKPFNSPSNSSKTYNLNRSLSYLKDINDPVDRQIGMLHNPINDTYLVGVAAGLSLVKGDTVKNKRNQICLEDSLLLSFSPSNTNKFYVSGINTSAFESGYYPAGYFKEVDYYVSYFDPSENVGQVYWYKDGNKYIIYCHCQSTQNVLAINVPKFMDGLKLNIVEKTDSTELLSDTISNGKFFVNYNTDDANYIVLITE